MRIIIETDAGKKTLDATFVGFPPEDILEQLRSTIERTYHMEKQ